MIVGTKSTHKNELHPFAFEIPPPKYSVECILKLLLDSNIDQSRVCRIWPVSGVQSSATFVVDVTSLKHPDDVRKYFLDPFQVTSFCIQSYFQGEWRSLR